MWELIAMGRPLMYCGNTTFIYHDNLSKYIKVEGATSEGVFDYLFDVIAGNSYLKKERNFFMNYLKSRIQSIFNLMKILIII